LVLGATGLLGQAFLREAARREISAVGAARRNAQVCVDITKRAELEIVLDRYQPDLVVNAAALVDLGLCERDPDLAFQVNASSVLQIADYCRLRRVRLVQVSTDHYFDDDQILHTEQAPVTLLNQYAKSKYAGEVFASTHDDALIVRTNITGMRGWQGAPTFAEWLIRCLEKREPLALFADYTTSTVDVETVAAAILDLVHLGCSGTYNIASAEPASKKEFAHALAQALDIDLDWAKIQSVRSLAVPRPRTCGLDVQKVERALDRPMPRLKEVCEALVAEHRCKNAVLA